jgi:hypothetical protein
MIVEPFVGYVAAQNRSRDLLSQKCCRQPLHKTSIILSNNNRHIISIRSAAGHGKVPDVANYLADQFRDGGFDDADIHVLPQTLSSGEETASLVVRYEVGLWV